MFSKSKINEPGPKAGDTPAGQPAASSAPSQSQPIPTSSAPKAKPPASVLSSDLHIKGNLKTTGDIQIEGQIEGDIRVIRISPHLSSRIYVYATGFTYS